MGQKFDLNNNIPSAGEKIVATDIIPVTKLKRYEENNNKLNESKETDQKSGIVVFNVITISLLHIAALVGAFYPYFYPESDFRLWLTGLKISFVFGLLNGFGVTAGAHRLWSHRSYKAKLPLRIFLATCFVSAGQNDLYEWCRDHRVHHKYSETDADPHNATRGFFFAHMGWLMVRKHPNVMKLGKNVPCQDLLEDPVVAFQKKHYSLLAPLLVLGLPSLWMNYFAGVPWEMGALLSAFRYTATLHITWLVNSAAHISGARPYDSNISPREENKWKYINFLGEMYHNFHHTFPQDYQASEYGWFGQWNLSALFIDCMAMIGQAYDLKVTPKQMIESRKKRTGIDPAVDEFSLFNYGFILIPILGIGLILM